MDGVATRGDERIPAAYRCARRRVIIRRSRRGHCAAPWREAPSRRWRLTRSAVAIYSHGRTAAAAGGTPCGLHVAGSLPTARPRRWRRSDSGGGRWRRRRLARGGCEVGCWLAGALAASRWSTEAAAASPREGALAGVARVLAQNDSACLYAAGTLKPASRDRDGYDGREESLARWSAADGGGWAALHGPLVRTTPPSDERQQAKEDAASASSASGADDGEERDDRMRMSRLAAAP